MCNRAQEVQFSKPWLANIDLGDEDGKAFFCLLSKVLPSPLDCVLPPVGSCRLLFFLITTPVTQPRSCTRHSLQIKDLSSFDNNEWSSLHWYNSYGKMYRERNSKDGCIQSYTTQSINQSYLTESSKMLDALKSRYITWGWALWRNASPLAAPRAIRTRVFHEIGWKNVPPVFENSEKILIIM